MNASQLKRLKQGYVDEYPIDRQERMVEWVLWAMRWGGAIGSILSWGLYWVL